MKTLSISAVIVAGFLLAVGSGLMGRTNDESAKSDSCCLNKPAASVSVAAAEGSCCSSSTRHAVVSADVAEKKSCGSCCGDKSQQVLATTEVATDEKSCGTGACCASKTATVLTTTEATDKKECAAGTCCASKTATVLTTTEATDKKECAAGACCQSKDVTVSTPAEKACDGKDCKPTGECCEARKATVLTATEATDKKECAAGTCCAAKSANVLASTEVADDKKCEDGTCPSQCPVSAAMAKLPKMTYSVGTEKVCCSEQAQALAEEHKAPIVYVVAEKTYECKTAAMTALVEETEHFVAAFTAPKKCEASGNVSLAGKAIACPVEAEKQVTLVSTAVEKIEMQYEVAGEKAACIVCATNKAKEKSANIEYVVGDQKTTCELSARMNLAVAKYKAAVQAVAASAVATEANAG
jgi:hypothetical protein